MTVRVWVCAILVLQVAALALAGRIYFARRTRPFALLLTACACGVVTRIAGFTLMFAEGFRLDASPSLVLVRRWAFAAGRVFDAVFLILLIFALIAFLRERSMTSTPEV
jgi:hypothetical protein